MTIIESLIAWDIRTLQSIRELVMNPSDLTVTLLSIVADWEVALFALALIWVWVLGVVRKQVTLKMRALSAFYCVLIAFIVYALINQLFPIRPRPEVVGGIAPLIAHVPDNSFPSGHAIFAGASIVAALKYLPKAWTIILAVSGILMVLSRIIIGVHYPLDIMVGLVFGAIIALVGSIMLTRHENTTLLRILYAWPLRIARLIRL